MTVNILILNYNGREILEECLPSVVLAAGFSKYPCKVTVIDNKSNDGSVEYLKKQFPAVNIIVSEENKVLCSYNPVFSKINDDLVVLLNNDIKVEKDFLGPLIEMFEKNNDAFMVGPKCLDFSKIRYEGTRSKPVFKLGMFATSARYPGYEKNIDKEGLTMDAALGLFDRRKFLLLGGYDELYLPGLTEDTDICYRAYRYGFRCYYQPKSIIYHKGQVSFKKFYSDRARLVLAHRNSFLFMWKNISDPYILLLHILLNPLRLFLALFRGKVEIILGFLAALKRLRHATLHRQQVKNLFRKSDREVLAEVKRNLVF
jgi:GT2 family glycosyltransferase